MTDQVSTPAAEPAAPQQVIDIAAITKEAAGIAAEAATKAVEKRATEMASSKLQEAGRALMGEKQEPKLNPILEHLFNKPEEFAVGLKDLAKKEMRQENAAMENHRHLTNAVAQPFISEYPQINTPGKIAMVEKITEQHQAAGLSYKDALKKGFEDTVKDLGLESVTEATKNGNLASVALPGMGGLSVGAQPQKSAADANASFLQGLKARASALRTKVPKA